MGQIRGLEGVFFAAKEKLKSKEDSLAAVFHCLILDENYDCVGVGDEWTETSSTSELLPSGWNSDQDGYSLRYVSKDRKLRLLLKLTKMEHLLQVDVVLNDDSVASMAVPVKNHVDDNFADFASAYKDLDSLSERFRKDVMQRLQPPAKPSSSSQTNRETNPPDSPLRRPAAPLRRPADLRQERDPYFGGNRGFPRVGGSDLDPFSRGGGGGMFMDPSGFGVPSARPPLSDFGVGGRGGLPRGAVPPGARFDPIRPPFPGARFDPDPDNFRPPDFDDDYYM